MQECEKRVYLYPGYSDMRLGIYGLIKKIGKPETDSFYAFCGKSKKTVKILEYHGHYAWLHTKRIFKGKINWPLTGDVTSVDLSSLKLVVDSIDIINKVELKGDRILQTF